MTKQNKTIEELLKIAIIESKNTFMNPRKFERTEDGKLILDPNKPFDHDWYENDKAYDVL